MAGVGGKARLSVMCRLDWLKRPSGQYIGTHTAAEQYDEVEIAEADQQVGGRD